MQPGAIKPNAMSTENVYEEQEWGRFFNLTLSTRNKAHVEKKTQHKTLIKLSLQFCTTSEFSKRHF